MTTFSSPPPRTPPASSNTLGLVGFIISLVGLFASCGLLSPVGMVVSLLGLFRQPRGFALAGFILGIIGSIWIIIAIAVIGVATVLLAAAGAVGYSVLSKVPPAYVDQVERIGTAAWAEVDRAAAAGAPLPATLDQLNALNPPDRLDPWGQAMTLDIDRADGTITLVSKGPDQQPGTGDDITVVFPRTGQPQFRVWGFNIDTDVLRDSGRQ